MGSGGLLRGRSLRSWGCQKDSQRESWQFVPTDSRESMRRKTQSIFITFERFARSASNLRFAVFLSLKRDSQKNGSAREPYKDSRESGHLSFTALNHTQDVGKGGLSLRGVAFMTDGFGGFDGFGCSGEHLALLLLVLQNTVPRGGRDGFGGFGGCGGFSGDGYPP